MNRTSIAWRPNWPALLWLVVAAALPPIPAQDQVSPPRPPNVLWIYVEDMNDWLGCYGDETVATPHLDALAARGTRFTRCYMPAGVCSPTRSAVITGCYQTTIGAHHHRSSRVDGDWNLLPSGTVTLPQALKAAMYHTFNLGKLDYNFAMPADVLYDVHRGGMNFDRAGDLTRLWQRSLDEQRPFFGQIQLRGGKNRPAKKVDRSAVRVPPYYPDCELVREEIAHHYDCIRKTDAEVGRILDELETDGLLANTVVFFFSDHGFRMHRHKQFLYDGGVRVPLLIAGPGVPKSKVRDDLVSGIDLAATTLSLMMPGAVLPDFMQGRNVFDAEFARDHVVSARDRCDFSIDRIRAVTTSRYRYLRNFLTDRPYMQSSYKDSWPVTKELRRMAQDGELDAIQMQFYGRERPREELYDLTDDPHEIHNLADDPAHRKALEHHRRLLDQWIRTTDDRGQQPESEAGMRAVLARWGDRCTNPEFGPVRERLAAERATLAKVLILGDSISMGYTPIVQSQLAKEAWVLRPKENCAGTTKGIAKIDDWLRLEGGDFDLIWFNFGLHDLKRVLPNGRNSNNADDGRQAEPEVYERQLRAITQKLKATGARLVFATTTPVPPGGVRPHRDVDDPERYNAIARRVMAEFEVEICDLYGFALARRKSIQPRVDVHFTKHGSRILGEHVAGEMRRSLAR
ncbi:MAG: sulfatase-like hydrolase/transferase [bacterium]|nr:sulfatase-like hydrolase/transferase [bacterium]